MPIYVYIGVLFLNNAALAAQDMLDRGASRVAILDIDYHHGNGTQEIFYDRDEVLFVSLHADPREEYPYFLGYADETGAGPGEGCNLNLPLRSEEHTSELQSLMRISYAVFCLKKKKNKTT